MGEGDWGGEGDLEKPDTHTQPSYTDWLMDFVGAGPPIVSSGPEDDNETRWDQLDSGPQPGPSTRPTSIRDLPTVLLPARGEVTSLPIQEEDISRVGGNLPSVSGQPSKEPDLQSDSTVEDPKTKAKPAVPDTRPCKPSEQRQDRQRTSQRLRPRDSDSEKGKPPSKVTKSVQWVKSLLGLNPSNNKDQGDPMTEGDNPEPSPTMTKAEEGRDLNPGISLSSDSDSEEEMDQSPDTTGDMELRPLQCSKSTTGTSSICGSQSSS